MKDVGKRLFLSSKTQQPSVSWWRACSATRSTVALIAAMLCGGCAIHAKLPYHTTVAEVQASSPGNLIVAVADQRPYVLDGKKASNFVGLARGGFGNPFDATTESGRSLAEDFGESICQSFRNAGFECRSVVADLNEAVALAHRSSPATEASRILLITIREWKSDTYVGAVDTKSTTMLYYDLLLQVVDEGAITLAEARVQGHDNLGGDSWTSPINYARNVLPPAFQKKLEKLLNAPEVVAAMRPSGG